MKRAFTILIFTIFLINFVNAEACKITTTLLNQDPYPAVPGDYVKMVFQIEGLEKSNDCRDITFELLEGYPLIFNPGESGIRNFNRVNYLKGFKSNILVPFEVRVDEDALNGKNPFEARITNSLNPSTSILEEFNLEVKDTKAEFEVHISDYIAESKDLTFEILNIADIDVEALTVYIPKQENIIIKGSNRVNVGNLDSNEYSSADFEATLKGNQISIDLIYSDSINVRRTVTVEVPFNIEDFTGRVANEKKSSGFIYYLLIAVLIIGFYIYRKRKKKAHSTHSKK